MLLHADVNRFAANRSLNRSIAGVTGNTPGATAGVNNECVFCEYATAAFRLKYESSIGKWYIGRELLLPNQRPQSSRLRTNWVRPLVAAKLPESGQSLTSWPDPRIVSPVRTPVISPKRSPLAKCIE